MDFEELEEYFEVGHSKSPFLYLPSRGLVFDTRTHMFYEIPQLLIPQVSQCNGPIHLGLTHRNQDETEANNISRPEDFVVLTSTHVIALYTYDGIHILAFTVDESAVRSGEELGVLRLSHKGISDRFYQSVTLLQNSVVDPVTGSIKMKLLDYVPDHFACDSLTLPKQSGDDVLPISVVDKQIAKIEELRVNGPRSFYGCYIHCSDAGHLRGFYRMDSPQGRPKVLKVAIDATQDGCSLATGERLLPEWSHIKELEFLTSYISFDGARGQLCMAKPGDGGDQEVVLVDLE